MAISKLALRTMSGIDRPALAALLPTLKDSDVVMLDLGANKESTREHLAQLPVMGAAYRRLLHGLAKRQVQCWTTGLTKTLGTEPFGGPAAALGTTRAQ